MAKSFLHQMHFDLNPYVNSILKKWIRCSSQIKNLKHPFTDNFANEITRLLIAGEIHTKVQDPIKSAYAGKPMWDGFSFIFTPRNLIEIASHLGFDVIKTKGFYSVRDHFFHLQDGTLHCAHQSEHGYLANLRTHSSNLYLERTAATHTKNQLFNSWTGFIQSRTPQIMSEFVSLANQEVKPFDYTYVEGGNVYTLVNREGVLKILIGHDHLIQTLYILDLEKRSWETLALETSSKKSFLDRREHILQTLSEEKIKSIAEEMFAEGLLEKNNRSGLLDRKPQLDILLSNFILSQESVIQKDDRGWFRKLAVKLGAINPFTLTSEEIEKCRPLVADYLTKKEITHELMAKDFGVATEQLHFITQVNYHLDTFIRPGPNQSLFLTNYQICAELLTGLATGSDALGLSTEDRQHLERYIETAKKFHIELDPLLKQVELQLVAAGFDVLPMPASFLYESATMYREFPMPSGGNNMNFINGLSGWSAKAHCHYYITHGMQVGEKLGLMLMDLFVLFLRQYVPDIEVYFIGRDPHNATDFSEAMDWWNRLETQTGVHCTTFELD